ncbi:hypothetical protein ACL03H_03820 [Saccharopolyspora sp. MS10]|uniref:hypothetical protein n=1 Tax=Saccharopolyspora sp. MS10 TaxID=3385973 RepID=UPI00399F3801
MAKNGDEGRASRESEPDLDVRDVTGALERARIAAADLKPKDAAVYWALRAQTGAILELRDALAGEQPRARGRRRFLRRKDS